MVKVELSPLARTDLAEIDDYSADEFGQEIADSYMRGFNDAFALLCSHPFAGALRTELGQGIRCLVHRKHRIFYCSEADRVIVIRIIHHARNAHNLLRP